MGEAELAEREGIRTLGWYCHHSRQAGCCLSQRRPLQNAYLYFEVDILSHKWESGILSLYQLSILIGYIIVFNWIDSHDGQ